MEFVIIILIILIYCLVLNVSIHYIILGAILFIGAVSALFTLAFVFCCICLLFSKRKEARFVRMGQVKNRGFQVAFYLVDGEEYPCIFPQEGVWVDKLYQKEKTYHVMLNKRMGKVFDRFAFTTSVLGLVFCTVVSVSIFMLFL